MLLLIYFNPIIGPDLLLSVPANVLDLISEDDIDQIKRLMDSATPGFFTHAFSGELNTVNSFFMIPSQWARGKQEMLMITKIIEEENPNLSSYETEIKKFISRIKTERNETYKALYINNPPLQYEEDIKREYNLLKQDFEALAKVFSLTEIQTHGSLIPFTQIKKHESLFVPAKILRDLESYLQGKQNYFLVFQKRKDSFKIDVVPYEKEKIIKITVLFIGQLGPETLKAISSIFQESKLPLVFTSGICQQGGKCIYEVYLDPQDITDFEPMKLRIKEIPKVDDVKIVQIDAIHRD